MAGEIESTTPESVDVAGAVALMGDLVKDVSEEEKGERDADTAADGGDGDDAAVAEADEEAGEGEEPEEAEDEAPAEGSDAPEFWSAEDKAAWDSVPAELRPVLKKYEQQRAGPALQQALPTSGPRSTGPRSPRRTPPNGRGSTRSAWTRRPFSPKPTGAGNRTCKQPPPAPSKPSSTPSTPSWRRSCPTISVRPRRRRRPTTSSASSCSPRASRPIASTRSMRPRSSKWRSTPCDSSRPRRELRPSRWRTRPREQHRLASLPDRPLAPATGRATRPGKWASGSGRTAETRSPMRPS